MNLIGFDERLFYFLMGDVLSKPSLLSEFRVRHNKSTDNAICHLLFSDTSVTVIGTLQNSFVALLHTYAARCEIVDETSLIA